VIDYETLDLLGDTANDLFTSDPSMEQLADLGWLALLTPQELDGDGWHPQEAVAIALAAGAARSPLAWWQAAVAVAGLASSPETRHHVPDILSGRTSATFCTATTIATGQGASVSGIDGATTGVVGLPADMVVVASESNDALVALFLDDKAAMGEDPNSLDTTRMVGTLQFSGSPCQHLDPTVLPTLVDIAQLLSCADTVGALKGATQSVTAHLGARDAFGVPMTSFQVLQHRLVDLTVTQLSSEALVRRAAVALSGHDASAPALVDAAHVYIQSRAVVALDDCIQLAGGMGFTWEFPVHHFLRRALTNSHSIRSANRSRQRMAADRGWRP
jgi:alkylation response protein AidB-like acyl-CoA dehydrogenase